MYKRQDQYRPFSWQDRSDGYDDLCEAWSSAVPAVRERLLQLQRDLASSENVIMDGRDIGTCVLPNADVKIFLTANSAVRAKRRYEELLAKGDVYKRQHEGRITLNLKKHSWNVLRFKVN